MFITNTEELVDALKPRLRDYLVAQLGDKLNEKKFNCFVHKDTSPSMYYNPKNGETTVHCFSCNATHDIFSAAAYLEGMPSSGPEWITVTLPHLANKLSIEVKMGEPSILDKERAKLLKLAADISNILEATGGQEEYLKSRGWSKEKLTIGSISTEALKAQLIEIGWAIETIQTSMMVQSAHNDYFGEDKVTFAIKDYRGRATGFVSRNQVNKPRYINTPETLIYEKRKSLLGIDVALAEAKRKGLYVVEGPGDLAALHRVGIYNAVAICGVAFTADHLGLLKMLGIRQVHFALDWDEAGSNAIHRILKEELKLAPGVSCWVVEAPETGEKDVSELLEGKASAELFTHLPKKGAFEWVLERMNDASDSGAVCQEMIPIIAAEPTAVRREILIKVLADQVGVSFQSILQDITNIRDGKLAERKERLKGVAEKFTREVETDPANIQTLMAQLESDVSFVEKDYQRNVIGVNYQLSRYDALQEQRTISAEKGIPTEFILSKFSLIQAALAGGMTWTDGVLIYVGGRANSGKTATVIAIGTDVALSDPDAIVVMHFTDDSYSQIEPRIKSNIAAMTRELHEPILTIGMAANPFSNINITEEWEQYHKADNKFRELISNEKLIIIDAEDGSTLSTLEKNLRHIRQRYPDKKLLVVCDNTHNYMDFMNLDQTSRMTRIANTQKMMTGKYHCCMIATAEYRKNTGQDKSKIKLPVDDDLADARAMMYRPNAIIHVYNDLHDREEHAEIVWKKPGTSKLLPRLMLCLTKNKISKFKDKLMLDLDPNTVTLKQYHADTARRETLKIREARESGELTVTATGELVIEATWDEEE